MSDAQELTATDETSFSIRCHSPLTLQAFDNNDHTLV